MNLNFIVANLFHEFTHIADSVKFLDCDYNTFQAIICLHSEIHASKVEMDKLLELNPLAENIDDTIIYNKQTTIRAIMDKNVREIEDSFSLTKRTINKNSSLEFFNIKWVCYLIGKIISLNEHNMDYEIKYQTLDADFKNKFDELYDMFVNQEFDGESSFNIGMTYHV